MTMEVIEDIRNCSDSYLFPRELCQGGQCPQGVLKLSFASTSVFIMVLVTVFDILRPFIIPTILAFVTFRLWSIINNRKRDVTCSLPLPPGSFGIPFLGETLSLLISGNRYFQNKRKTYGDVYKTHLLGKPTIRVIGPENVKQILRGENTIVETQWPTSTCILLGEGCVSHASGADHVTKKKIIMRAFTFSALSGYVPVIQTVTRQYIRKWCSQRSIMGYPEFKMLNFDLSCRLLAGFKISLSECRRLMDEFEVFCSNIFSIPVDLPGSGFRRGLLARETLLQTIDDIIAENEKLCNQERKSVLSILMGGNSQDKLSKKELKNMCLELLFAGHGTTSSTATFLVYELAKHPEVRKKIEAEMASLGLIGNENDKDLDFELLNKMTYVSNVVKEVLRLCPPIGGGFRKALKTFEINGFQIPKGWAVTYSIRDTHETSGHFVDHHVFNPDRWTNSNTSKHQFQYIPFGGGKRACAGKDLAKLMLKIFAVELVRNCEWKLDNANTKFKTFPLPVPIDNMPLNFTAKTNDFRIRAHTV